MISSAEEGPVSPHVATTCLRVQRYEEKQCKTSFFSICFKIVSNVKRERYPKRHSTYGRVKVKTIQLFLGKYIMCHICHVSLGH